MATQATAVSRVKQHENTMLDLFNRAKPTIESMIPKHMSADRLLKIALIATHRTPLLLQSTPKSVLQSVINAAQLGLEVNSPLGHAYLVPFKSGKLSREAGHDVYECTLIPGYRGYVDLAHRSGLVNGIYARPVFADDYFEYEDGLEPKVVHRPNPEGTRSPKDLIACYAVGVLRGGFRQPMVMYRLELDSYRARSRAKDSGPWQTDPIQMYQKTPVRQLIKFMPLSPELGRLSELDNRADTGEAVSGDDILDFDFETGMIPAAPDRPTGTEALRNRLGAGQAQQEPPPPEPPPGAVQGDAAEPGDDDRTIDQKLAQE